MLWLCSSFPSLTMNCTYYIFSYIFNTSMLCSSFPTVLYIYLPISSICLCLVSEILVFYFLSLFCLHLIRFAPISLRLSSVQVVASDCQKFFFFWLLLGNFFEHFDLQRSSLAEHTSLTVLVRRGKKVSGDEGEEAF